MNTIGIVAEYNPFHTGHAHQIAQSRKVLGEDSSVVAVMSGNWVQQADCAVADKWTRARLALMGGADLVLELPTVWAMSSAESFARGAVSILHACGVVDAISFGSECGDVDKLCRVAQCLDSEAYRAALTPLLDKGESFAACRQRAVEQVLGREPGSLLAKPNNNLGVEYIRALNALKSEIKPMTVLRQGAGHNEVTNEEAFRSATQLREEIAVENWNEVEGYLPCGGLEVLKGASRPSLLRAERAILARLRTMTAEDWGKLPDSGETEGLTRRLERSGRTCADLADFFERAKTRRFTHARLRRLVLWAYLGLSAADVPETPPYIRVLGSNERGRRVLAQMRKKAALPVITKPAHVKRLDGDARRLFELERRCTDLYDLCMDTISTPGREWTCGPVAGEE